MPQRASASVQGFYMRVVPSKHNLRNTFKVEEAIAMSLRAATTFTIGFGAFYAFIPLVGPCSVDMAVHPCFLLHTSKADRTSVVGAADVAVWVDMAAGRHSAGGGGVPHTVSLLANSLFLLQKKF